MFRRWEVYVIALLLLLSLGGCKKKYNCSHNYFYMGVGVSFGGFDTSELKKVVFQQYVAGSNFKKLKASDTVDLSGAVFQNDTAYLSISNHVYYKTFFYLVSDSIEYIVTIPAANRSYAMNVTRGEMTQSWWRERECSWGAGTTRNSPHDVKVNGEPCPYYSTYPNNFFVCLRR